MTTLLVIASSPVMFTGFEHSDDGLKWKERSLTPSLLNAGLNTITVQDKPMRYVRPLDTNIVLIVEAERLMDALGLSPNSSPTFKGLTVTDKIAASNMPNGFFGRGPTGQAIVLQSLPQEGDVVADQYILVTMGANNYIIPCQQT